MERETKFVDVILPLALPRLLTYRVPHDLNSLVGPGQRVVVQLRDNKLFTGLIREVHNRVPVGYEARYFDDLMDEHPIVNERQFRLWEWMAKYYGCYLGEVMSAALPPALKLSSETKIVLSGDIDDTSIHWSDREWQLLELLREKKELMLKDLPKLMGIKSVHSVVKSLVDKNMLSTSEELKEKFKPKKTDFIWLGPKANTEESLQQVFNDLEKRKAGKQSDALLSLLQLGNFDSGSFTAVERTILQKSAGVDLPVIRQLEEKGIITIESRETGRLASNLLPADQLKSLSGLQSVVRDEIIAQWEKHEVVLLKGVTSSGKTEIYSDLISDYTSRGFQVLFLLPEIALTTQIIGRLRKYFGKQIGVYHSGYSDNERTEVWRKVMSDVPGECDIVLGARSALFLPFNRLGLIIVDEEHETSYKQTDPSPRYHARDMSVVLAAEFGAKVLLGSATPAIESYWNAQNKRFGFASISERFGGVQLPEIIISDLRIDVKNSTLKANFGSQLHHEMSEAFKAGEQVILFQNRRGYSPIWQCHTCGWIPECTRCDVSLTYHKVNHQLKCHYCGYTTDPVKMCSQCGSSDLRMLGFGTERVEEDIETLFPDIRVARLDLDTTRSKSSYRKILDDFESNRVQVLVGTQMVTKGLDFDNVSLVGILHADKLMNYPDFRSFERSFQLMMQVAGRAGRKSKRGKVVIQTYAPQHWLLDMVLNNDYEALYQREIAERRHYVYPPFVRLIKLTFKHRDEEMADKVAFAVGKALRNEYGERILGPERPYIPRINNYFLRQILIKLERGPGTNAMKEKIIQTSREISASKEFGSVRLVIDVDPV